MTDFPGKLPICPFDIPANDAEAIKKLYSGVFGLGYESLSYKALVLRMNYRKVLDKEFNSSPRSKTRPRVARGRA